MRETDNRHLSLDALSEKRRIALRMNEKGYKRSAIAEIVDVNPGTLSDWFSRVKREGKEAVIMGSKRGVSVGTNRSLTAKQEYRIQRLMTQHMPDELGLETALWTRQAVLDLIRSRCHVTLPISTAGLYLKRWGFTPQKPARQAYERQPEAVKRWLDEDYPALKARAKEEGAEIHWGDETGIRNHCQHGRSYAPKGKTPVQKLSGSRFGLNMISTVTNQGKVRFMLYEERMTADVLIRFLERLLRGAERKIFLILDNLKVHHANKVKEWVEARQQQLELFFLPTYSPDLNPDEYLNGDLKAQVHSGKATRNKKELKQRVNKAMRLLQKRPQRVSKYFRHPAIAYAA